MFPNTKRWTPAPSRASAPDMRRLTLSAVLNIVCVGGGLLMGALLIASLMPAALDVRFYFYKAIVGYVVILFAVLAFLHTHRPHTRFGPANTVTLIRAALVCLLAALYGESWGGIELLVACVAIVALSLDGVDGWLARLRGTQSRFGARFDMETDALLVLVLSLLAWQSGQVGPWVLIAGLMRYAFMAAALAANWLNRPLPASLRRKTVCVLQIIGLIACVAPILPDALRQAAALAAVIMVSGSFAVDVAWLGRMRRIPMPPPDPGPVSQAALDRRSS